MYLFSVLSTMQHTGERYLEMYCLPVLCFLVSGRVTVPLGFIGSSLHTSKLRKTRNSALTNNYFLPSKVTREAVLLRLTISFLYRHLRLLLISFRSDHAQNLRSLENCPGNFKNP